MEAGAVAAPVASPSALVSGAPHAVQVSCRFRCQNDAEANAGGSNCVAFPDAHTFVVNTGQSSTRHSSFDFVFSLEATQEEIFKKVGVPYVYDLLAGYNCTILAYGQTGSGKTFTTMGDKQARGLLPRLLEKIFEEIDRFDRSGIIMFRFFY